MRNSPRRKTILPNNPVEKRFCQITPIEEQTMLSINLVGKRFCQRTPIETRFCQMTGNHTCAQQSRQATLVPSMSLPAGSDTVTSLYRVLFHLSLMVLVCCWSQTQILLCMNFTTCFTHYSQGTRLFEDTPCTESCRRHIGFSPLSMLFSRGVLLHLNW